MSFRPSTASRPQDLDGQLSEMERAEVDRQLVRRLDLKLMPWLCLMYCVAFLDRTDVGNAKIANLTADLGTTDRQFGQVLATFFASYSIFEPLANVLMRKFGPRRFLPTIAVIWGVLMAGMGFVHDWRLLFVPRVLLGAAEAGMFPGICFYISCWYRRDEFGVRVAIFFSSAAVSGSVGGLLAAAMQSMDGIAGLAGWRWIFIVEGILTMIVGMASFWMVHNFPEDATFLGEVDRARVIARLAEDRQLPWCRLETFSWKTIWTSLTDWKTWMGMIIFSGALMPVYSISLLMPSVISTLSFTTPESIIRNQLLCVPPYVMAGAVTVIAALASDQHHTRGYFTIALAPIAVVGFSMLLITRAAEVAYIGVFLATIGCYASLPIVVAWIANNAENNYKRALVLGIVIGVGNLNGIVTSKLSLEEAYFFRTYSIIVAYLGIGLFGGSILFRYFLYRENMAKEAGRRDYRLDNRTAYELQVLGDRNPGFRHAL
ncbi:major facilitator superfamily domain-containing protein [Podospora didyma]|uniref:Major facilitator superfamily domain-containing protein n=1 Tax=Podospora didyma TaxID=330526 RepID=A0AAE0NXC2_9PEZI|nr:major facilitator superfamily domain-containing protein [Podospora didyma]